MSSPGYMNPEAGAFAACVRLLLPLAPLPAAAAFVAVPAVADTVVSGDVPAVFGGGGPSAAGSDTVANLAAHGAAVAGVQSSANLPSPGSTGSFSALSGVGHTEAAAPGVSSATAAVDVGGTAAQAFDGLRIGA